MAGFKEIPNFKLHRECSHCGNWTFGQYDSFCPRCRTILKDSNEWLVGIRDYAKSLLVDFLEKNSDFAMKASFDNIPDYATEHIRNNRTIMSNQPATQRVLAENWAEVEEAITDWQDLNCTDIPSWEAEPLHVFAVTQHADMVWRSMRDLDTGHLDEGTIAEAVHRLKHWL
jgi:hypothetical protein